MGRSSRLWAGVSGFFWGLALALVILFVFLAGMGAWDPLEVVTLSVAVLAVAVLWVAHATWVRRRADPRAPDVIRQRERRGF